MVRYLGPKLKKLKQLNVHVQPGFTTKYCKTSLKVNKAIMSFYLMELIEKQKLKFTFSLSEKVIKNYILFVYKNNYKKFELSNILELRLDTILFNLGYCITILQARQLIVHGHFFVNFVLIRRPSFLIKKGDIINVSPYSLFIFNLCKKNLYYKYLEVFLDSKNFCICFTTLTTVIYSPINISSMFLTFNEFLIINYYKH